MPPEEPEPLELVPEEPVSVPDEPHVSDEPVRDASNAYGRKEEVAVVGGACWRVTANDLCPLALVLALVLCLWWEESGWEVIGLVWEGVAAGQALVSLHPALELALALLFLALV